MAAALALCYHTYRASDPTYANQCLLSAEHIFDLANTTPSGNLLTVIPFSFYPETEWREDLEFGATELYFALQGASSLPMGLPHNDGMFYLQKAAHWANAYITGPNDAADTLNLYDVSGLAHFELYRALGLAGNPAGLETTQAALLADLKKQLDKAVAQGNTDPFGFGFPWNTYDTTSHGGGLAVMAAEYTYLTGMNTYTDNANRWLGNILGANAWGTSLIVGNGTTFPHCMQHQVANLAGSLNGSPPLLSGAAVEGPNSVAAKGTLSGMIACPIVPAAIEMMDNLTIRAIESRSPSGYPVEAEGVVLIEVDGLREEVEAQSEAVQQVCRDNRALSVRLAKDEAERAALWAGRKGAFAAIGRLTPDYYTVDGVVPRTKLPATLARIQEISRESGFRIANVFHAGDGNLHPLIMWDADEAGAEERVIDAGAEIMQVCAAAGGSLTGEHGIGMEKKDLMPLIFSQDDVGQMLKIKDAFDPSGLSNPGKMFPTAGRCLELFARRGRAAGW